MWRIQSAADFQRQEDAEEDLKRIIDEKGERIIGLYQQIAELKRLNETMRTVRSEAGLNEECLKVAKKIEEIFVMSHESTYQRRERIRVTVRSAMERMLVGEPRWSASTDFQNADDRED